MYSTRTAIVTMVYADTLTRGVGDRVVVCVEYAYCLSYYGRYPDTVVWGLSELLWISE